MAAPSITGGITVLETCDTGSSGLAPSNPLTGSTVNASTSYQTTFAGGLGGTGSAALYSDSDIQAGALMGGQYALSASTDLSVANRLTFVHYTTSDRVKDIAAGDGGMLFVTSDSTGANEAAWPINGGNSPNTAWECAVVNVSRSTDAHIYNGSFSPSTVTHIGVAADFDVGFSTFGVETIGYVDPIVVINGETANKGDFTDVTTHISSNDTTLNESPTSNIHHCFFGWGVGNGSTLTEFSENLKVFEFARQVDISTQWGRAHINDNDIGFEVNASASDVIDFTLCNWISDNAFYWNSIGSTSATVSYTSCIIKNAGETTIVDGHSFDGCTFDDCAVIVANSPTFSGCSFKNATGAALELDSGGDTNITNCTFSGNQTAVLIDVAGAASLDVTEFNFDTSNTYYIEYTGTGTLTVTSPVSIPAGKLNASGGGTITVVAPTTTFTINSSEASSLIQIFTTGTQTLLDSTTGTSLAYTYSGTVVVDYVVQKAGFLPQRFTGVTLSNSSVSVVLESDPVYDSAHGLTYTTDFSYNRSTKKLTLSTRQEGRSFYSALIDAFIAQTTLRNTAFDFKAVGPDSIFFLDDAEIIDATSEDNWKGAGIRYLDSSDVVTAEWCSVKSSGTIPSGATGEFQQVAGSGTTDLRATGAVDQIIKIYGDATHGNFDYRSHLVIKYQINGYREARADVLDLAGISTLEPFEYSVALSPTAITAATGDPAITLTITDHGATPVTWNSKAFSITVQYSGATSGEEIIRELNYNLSLDTTYQGKDPFNWPEMVLESGSAYETLRGITEGGTGASLKGVRVVNASGDPHPDFTRFQADDGTYYTVPVTATGQITNIVTGSRVRIYNETTLTETYNNVPGTSYSVNYTDGTTYSSGDVIKIYITQTSGTTAQLPFTTTVIASSSGWSALADQQDDTVYNQYAIDGSGVTKFSADYTDDEVDLIVASNFSADEMYAWWAYNLTTSQGIADFFGGLTAEDAANLKINNSVVDIKLDNTTASNVYQTDNIRIYRADSAYPVKNPTTGGGGIDVVWRDRVYIAVTGSGVTAQDKADIKDLVFGEVMEGTETFKEQTKLIRAEAAGKLLVSGTTVTIRDALDTKDRVTATVDSNGQRTSVTVDGS